MAQDLPVSPLAPAGFPDLPAVAGVRTATLAAGLRYQGRPDLFLAVCDEATTAAGVFTTSKTASAPVDWCRQVAPHGAGRALLVNAGNANAFTGRAGRDAVAGEVAAVTGALGCAETGVWLASTGVIGEPMDAGGFPGHLAALVERLGPPDWRAAADAIRTTDTFAKGAGGNAQIDGTPVALAGVAKGSGMIAPHMATMLAFLFTDAAIAAPVLRQLVADAADHGFNRITVDGDTSTSDSVVVFATGRAGNRVIDDPADPALDDFRALLQRTCLDLAQQIVRDGEGASRFVEVRVSGAETPAAARRIAFAIANSPIVKAAVAGGDPNWGRVVMAVGKSGEAADRDRLAIRFGDLPVAEAGARHPAYDEAACAAYFKGAEIVIAVDVGVGTGTDTVWTCDLTHGYIAINADYRS
ncbi:glutamate N-acetyltransferase [Rhodothalassium salexigens DSM 2132]|uniref:Arginine biosynthesis bifunctional protein ArgJ n=1 Tax=Rhodothalassium salexigens DSM 2132 TaxID=1188247 RepID=A0A4R2PKC5_RHOSA|nr:bifunctional glutamate N-acetyltransferase/amino-acid acetyltransferase ArgJ [Rhodothalassium salexigens]MBB4211603.1 glutamate N-acetyltransferase/amino-acid N-acetyltransferase [Rhodothalassium salexigens DSM 2132]MBK1639554.1 bifunctional ornithine acetyltransferase/N-acetylglutamate synthase [Rhodothalassium salexigens DSM 2132]TCP34465.1 glutamate N-acetyltransferase [Rhodothalassium salexigens DSM 2132]